MIHWFESILFSALAGASRERSLWFDLGTAWSVHINPLLILLMEISRCFSVWRQSSELLTTTAIIHHHLLIWIVITCLKTLLTSSVKTALAIILG